MVSATIRAVPKGEAAGDASKAFWVKCSKCSHCWAAAYYPLEAGLFAKIAMGHTRCPKCGDPKSFVAKQADGVLLEPRSPDQRGEGT